MNESVQKWLDELTAAPTTAIQKLLLGYSGVSAWSRSSLRESFVEIYQTHARLLDVAVATWLQKRLMKLPPDKTPILVWASHLQDLFSAIAGLPLPQVARLLRDQMRDFRSWLRPLRTDDGLDPEVAYLSALAWAETNQHLEGMWQGLALRRNQEPVYYTDVGLLGLRKTRDNSGQLPAKAPFLLLATLIDLADTGVPQKDWLLTTRAMLGGYHYSLETWVREFEPVLDARHEARNGPKWIKRILPALTMQQVRSLPRIQTPTRSDTDRFVLAVRKAGPLSVGPTLDTFLDSQRLFANASRDSYHLVRSFNRLAEAARLRDPEWAVARAEEALTWDDNNARNWTVLARSLWARGLRAEKEGNARKAEADCREAIDTLWDARLRFPWDKVGRKELARLHRDAGDFETAEVIYREAMAEFPDDDACRNGLADVFTKTNRIREAEALYRETRLLFGQDPYSRTGLAEILFHRSAANRNEAERDEARLIFREAAELNDRYAQRRVNDFDQRWAQAASQQQPHADVEHEANETIGLSQPAPEEMRPAQRLGRALLLQWQARRAESAEERERLFAKAEALLDLADELTGECRTAFVEARGFLLLARDRPTEARAYFERELVTFSRPPLGLRLGFAEARACLGETLGDLEEAEFASFGPKGSILPHVLKVVRLLESTDDDELRDLLLELYPRVLKHSGMPASELGEEDAQAEPTAHTRYPETPNTMMAQLLLASVFRPAAINTPDDLRAADSILRLRTSFKACRNDLFSVVEKLALVE